ncbi:MAG: DUF5017 domain-containing protein [Bacteroidales bacterium]|nr:DUF5017 domain-containing protein [Bacteroidales bacterium]
MKNNFTRLFLIAMLFSAVAVHAQDGLFISEVADPGDEYTGRFIELYNAGDQAVDFGTTVIYLSRQSNGGSTWGNVQLTGTVAAGETFVLGGSAFTSWYGFAPDQETGILSGNGDDAYFLYTGGDHSSGTLHDIYGAIDTDGTGEAWEYLDSRAYRVGGITAPNTTWTASEWEITPANVADFDPGVHSTEIVVDTDPPVFETGYPMADNIEDVQFDLMAQLDETSTVYYVVLEDGATEPTVAEVKAGTGSGGADAVVSGSFAAGTSVATETVTGLTVEVSYDVFVVAEDDEATPNVQAGVSLVEVTTVVMPDVILKAAFDTDLTPFTQVSVVGDGQVWVQDSYNNDGYAKMSGYSGGAQDNDDYLISPAIDLDGSTSTIMSFATAANYSGPLLEVYISEDFTGTYDATEVGNATWTDISSNFSLSGGSWDWVESGEFDFTGYSGTVYIAFRYQSNPTDGAATWEVDNFMVTGFLPLGSDATLSDLTVDGTTVTGFDAATYTYTVELPAGTTAVPAVTATTTDQNATVVITDATDLSGDAAARTTTVEVTAQNGETTQTYSVVFNPVLEVADLGALRAAADETRKYIVAGEVYLTFQQSYRSKKYVQDANGGVEIDDSPGTITTTYEIGDGITGLEGTVEIYNGLLQFHPTADPGAATSTGNTLEPIVATPAEINADIPAYESRLVTVENVTIDEADGSTAFEDGSNYTINGASETMVLRVHFYGTSLTGEVIPDSANVTGIVVQYYGTAQLSPRSADDVVELVPYVPSNDATLSDLMVDGASIDGFTAAQLSYYVILPQGTTDVPVVTATATDGNATIEITDATDLTGDAAARTTTVVVTAEDGVTVKTYTVEFTVDVSVRDDVFSKVEVYPVPATNTLRLNNASHIRALTVFDITGSAVMRTDNTGNEQIILDITSLDNGVYMIRMSDDETTGVVRFVKQ